LPRNPRKNTKKFLARDFSFRVLPWIPLLFKGLLSHGSGQKNPCPERPWQ
jgi:hypothetical protein